MSSDAQSLAARIIHSMAAAGVTVAAGESVTGGGCVTLLTSIPGASAVVRGGVVAYASEVKTDLLHVDEVLLAEHGPVCHEVAAQMARGARDILAATYGIATTGEAGPDSASGQPVGTVHVAVSGPSGTVCRCLPRIGGDRDDVRRAAVVGALRLLDEVWQHSSPHVDTHNVRQGNSSG